MGDVLLNIKIYSYTSCDHGCIKAGDEVANGLQLIAKSVRKSAGAQTISL